MGNCFRHGYQGPDDIRSSGLFAAVFQDRQGVLKKRALFAGIDGNSGNRGASILLNLDLYRFMHYNLPALSGECVFFVAYRPCLRIFGARIRDLANFYAVTFLLSRCAGHVGCCIFQQSGPGSAAAIPSQGERWLFRVSVADAIYGII
jgi:hypothetical protein